jgi:hypothetical protein
MMAAELALTVAHQSKFFAIIATVLLRYFGRLTGVPIESTSVFAR